MNSKCDSQDGAAEGVAKKFSREDHGLLENSQELMCDELLDDNFELVHSNLKSITGSSPGLLTFTDPDPTAVHKQTGEKYGFADSCSKNHSKQISLAVSL